METFSCFNCNKDKHSSSIRQYFQDGRVSIVRTTSTNATTHVQTFSGSVKTLLAASGATVEILLSASNASWTGTNVKNIHATLVNASTL